VSKSGLAGTELETSSPTVSLGQALTAPGWAEIGPQDMDRVEGGTGGGWAGADRHISALRAMTGDNHSLRPSPFTRYNSNCLQFHISFSISNHAELSPPPNSSQIFHSFVFSPQCRAPLPLCLLMKDN